MHTRAFAGDLLRRFPGPFAYLVGGLALGSVYFTVLVTGWSLALTIPVLGTIPVLLLMIVLLRAFAAGERAMATSLLGADVGPAWRPAPQGGLLERMRDWVTDRDTWREQAFLLSRFVVGLPAGALAVSTLFWGLSLIAAPALSQTGADMFDFGFWEADTVAKGFLLTPLGIAVTALSVPLTVALGALSRRLAESLLRNGAATDAGRRAPRSGVPPLPARGIPAHAVVSGVVAAVVVAIWALAGRGYFWPVWVVFGLSIPLALHAVVFAGLEVRDARTRGFVFFAGIAAVLGMVCVVTWLLAGRGYFWPAWPLLGLATAVGIYALIAFTALLPRDDERARLTHRVEELTRTRAGAVDAEADVLRRVERDLHDGAQARLVSLMMTLGLAEDRFGRDPAEVRDLVREAKAQARLAITELRNLARGIAPPILVDRGLEAALDALVVTTRLPATLEGHAEPRPPASVETCAYFVATEALANAAKHAAASEARIVIDRRGDVLTVEVIDDGRGGADPSGSGLVGLRRRVESVDGTLTIWSPSGGPTRVRAELPCA
jgi:signal transduction histidine kinase